MDPTNPVLQSGRQFDLSDILTRSTHHSGKIRGDAVLLLHELVTQHQQTKFTVTSSTTHYGTWIGRAIEQALTMLEDTSTSNLPMSEPTKKKNPNTKIRLFIHLSPHRTLSLGHIFSFLCFSTSRLVCSNERSYFSLCSCSSPPASSLPRHPRCASCSCVVFPPRSDPPGCGENSHYPFPPSLHNLDGRGVYLPSPPPLCTNSTNSPYKPPSDFLQRSTLQSYGP